MAHENARPAQYAGPTKNHQALAPKSHFKGCKLSHPTRIVPRGPASEYMLSLTRNPGRHFAMIKGTLMQT